MASLKGIRVGTQIGQEPEGRNKNRGHGVVGLTGLLSLGLFSLLSFREYLFGNTKLSGNIDFGLDTPTSITGFKNLLTTYV